MKTKLNCCSILIRKSVAVIRTLLLVLAVAVVAFASGHATQAQAQTAAAQFPDPSRVTADYPDEVQRYVAFQLLWDVLHEKAPDAPDARAKRSTYYNASEAIRNKYMVMGTAGATDFDTRNRQLSADRNFKRSVLEKYHLDSVPVQRAAPAPFVMRNTDVTDSMIKMACAKALPFMLVSFVLMVLLTKPLVRKASTRSAVNPPALNPPGDLPRLPESLRVISLPYLQYSVEVISALAMEKETTIHTSVHTSTSGGQVYTVGNEVHSTPIQTSTSVSSTQNDLIWIRTAEGRESSWNFSGGVFKVRPGHIISAITRSARDGTEDFMIAYNHNTGQLEQFGVGKAHGTKSGFAWIVATLVGSIGFAIAVAIILSIQPDSNADPVDKLLAPVVDWIMGGMASAVVALFVVMQATGSLTNRRNNAFKNQYLPGFRSFLAQSTLALQKHFIPVT
ncbi:MAG: hypothetical protein JWR19_4122 [Pedosphaera sp.]|nr:hypothetical protein [Pedosphaera sp.]